MAKDKTKEKEYKAEGLRRLNIRINNRKAKRKLQLDTYGPEGIKRCNNCDDYMTWCSCCEMYSRYCCEEYGTCMCS